MKYATALRYVEAHLEELVAQDRARHRAERARERTDVPDPQTVRPSKILARNLEEVLAIGGRHRALRVHVFGSVARGEDRPESDLDLLVTSDSETSLFDQVNMREDIENLLGVHPDLVSDHALGDITEQARDL